jgi:hypothetical protein
MAIHIQRREFVFTLGGAAAAWPLAARSQQGERMRRIGVLLPAAPDDAEVQSWVGAFLQGLAQWGWITGRNIRIETRWTKFDAEDTRKYARPNWWRGVSSPTAPPTTGQRAMIFSEPRAICAGAIVAKIPVVVHIGGGGLFCPVSHTEDCGATMFHRRSSRLPTR